MKIGVHIWVGVLVVGMLGCTKSGPELARADLRDATGKAVGTVHLEGLPTGIRIKAEVSGLTPGEHAFHIHAKGACTAPDFKSAGGHFNPFETEHGLRNVKGPHGGDLPNLVVGADGRGKLEALAALVTLSHGEGAVLRPGGTAIVIHAGPDDGKSQPAGAAGPRVACGVIHAAGL